MSDIKLSLIMPMCRRWHFPRLLWGWLVQQEPHPFALRIHLAMQGPEPDFNGINKTNEQLASIRDGWVYLTSDDTVHFPSLLRRLGEVIAENPDCGAVVFSEERPGGQIIRANKDTVIPCQICGSMIFYRRDTLGDDHYLPEQGGQSDGYLAQRVYQRDPAKWQFRDEVLCRFNSLMQ